MNGSNNGKARLFAIGMIGLMLAGAMVAFTQNASAQFEGTTNVVVTVDSPTSLLKPITEIMTLNVKVAYTYPPGYGAAGSFISPTAVSLTAEPQGDAATWCTASINPAQVFMPIEGTTALEGGTVEKTATVTIHLTGDAPASATPIIKIKASAAANGGYAACTNGDGYNLQFGIGYYSIIQATVPQPLQKGAPYQQIVYPITVSNLGNGKTKVFFDVKNVPTGWQVTLPAPIILESRQQGGKTTSQTVNVIIFTPYKTGYQNNVGSIKIDITSKYADDTTINGDATSINTLTLSKGFYVPGFDAIIMIGAIGFVALFFRRK